jgi:hypothetical protein
MRARLASVFFFALLCAPAADRAPIVLDPASGGRVFEGIGAASAGASSRLLIEYPEPQRSQVLDYLFKPRYGAGFQHLKVEIGGDVNSTDGIEPSHMHTRDDENYTRGYEWWLMKEAVRRNPAVILDTLEWGAPYWIGGGKFFSQDNADYIAKFIQGAKRVHGLDIAYTGIWNETPYEAGWIKLLRVTLDRAGLTRVRIVAADITGKDKWNIVREMQGDPALHAAIHTVGAHYVAFESPAEAKTIGKPIWSSEDGPWRGDWKGAAALARIYNRNYVIGKMTKTVIWSPVTSYYDNLPLPGSGVMRANQPWSGHYEVQPATWITAHTTQFAQPGWKYVDSACRLIDGGSVAALRSPDGRANSIVIETIDAAAAQTLTFQIKGAGNQAPVHVWRSDEQAQFLEIQTLAPAGGSFSITVEPKSVYSLTTTTGQRKAAASPPPSKPFPMPYREDFERYAAGATPRYFSDQAGVFEVVPRAGGKGRALAQMIPQKGIEWHYHRDSEPETFLGATEWRDYEVSVEAMIESTGFVSLFGRVAAIPQLPTPPAGYRLKVNGDGAWQLSYTKVKESAKVIAEGRAQLTPGSWHKLALRFTGKNIAVILDGAPAGAAEDTTFAAGMAGIGSGWHPAQFDNLEIRPLRN